MKREQRARKMYMTDNKDFMGSMEMSRQKTCLDCLNCKVSAKSTDKCRLCFCSETKKKINRKETYWLTKKLCDEFEDMTA
jgi:hypothetical protein